VRMPDRIAGLRIERPLVGVCAAVFVCNLGFGMILPIVPIYARSYGASAAVIGLMVSAVAAGRLALQLPAGYLADVLGDRRLAASGLALYVPAMLGMAALPSPAVFVPLRLLEGCAEGIALPALYAIISTRSAPDRIGTSFGLFTASATASLAVAPGIGGLIAGVTGPRLLFVLVAAAAGLAALIVLVTAGDPPAGAARAEQRPGWTTALRALPGTVAARMVPALAFTFAGSLAFAVALTVVPLYASDVLRLSRGQLGLLFTLSFAVFSFGQPIAGRLSDRVGRRSDLLVAGVAMGAAFALLGLASTFTAFAAILVVEAFAACWVVVSSRRLASRAANAVAPALAFAVLGVVGDAGSLLGPVSGAVLYAAGQRWPFVLIAAVTAAALACSLVGKEDRAAVPAC
jgi:MFS transporter, DHA1 family, multidrug resistance protein